MSFVRAVGRRRPGDAESVYQLKAQLRGWARYLEREERRGVWRREERAKPVGTPEERRLAWLKRRHKAYEARKGTLLGRRMEGIRLEVRDE